MSPWLPTALHLAGSAVEIAGVLLMTNGVLAGVAWGGVLTSRSVSSKDTTFDVTGGRDHGSRRWRHGYTGVRALAKPGRWAQ